MLEHFLVQSAKLIGPVIPDSGPGPATFKKYEAAEDVGYFGTLTFAEFFTIEAIEAIALTALPGTPKDRTSANKWIKTYYKGKILYVLFSTVRSGTNWNDIYKAGFMYGVDGPGTRPPASGPVNQLRTLTKVSGDGKTYTFKVRAIQTYMVDPYPAGLVTADILNSEYSQIRERFNHPINGGPPQFYWETFGNGLNGQTLGPESSIAGTNALMLNNNSTYLRRDSWDKTNTSFCNFYPVLELVSVTGP